MVINSSREFICGNPQDFRDRCEQCRCDLPTADHLPPEDGLRGNFPALSGKQVCKLAGLEVPLHARLFQVRPAQPPLRIGDKPERERQRVSLQGRRRVISGGLPCGIQQPPRGAGLALLHGGEPIQGRRFRTSS